jgi:hypothetical protein
MNFCNKVVLFFFFICANVHLKAQVVERIFQSNIKTVQLFEYGNQQGLPVYKLKSNSKLELDFDDMDANFKSYYFTYILCDYNWKPANLSVFDFIKGFTQNRITTYRYSSIAYKRYTHYQAFLPDQNSLRERTKQQTKIK